MSLPLTDDQLRQVAAHMTAGFAALAVTRLAQQESK